jgi:endonuclease G, mitochondrial
VSYLCQQEVQSLVKAAVDSDLLDTDRRLLHAGIYKPFRSNLVTSASPRDQFMLDLVKFNDVERLEDNSVPLAQFLQNAAALLRLSGRPEAELFERLANRIGNKVQGLGALPEPASLPEITRNEAIVHQDDMVRFDFLAEGVAVGRSVARLSVPRFQAGKQVLVQGIRPWLMSGTGWMIGPRLLVTNHHVINAREAGEPDASEADFLRQGANTAVDFDYDNDDAKARIVVACKVEAANKQLDYAILRLKEDPNCPVLELSSAPFKFTATTYLPVNIIQYPRGGPKKVAMRNNLVSGCDADTLRYFTDTDFGSSGAPVCDDAWKVIALHRGAKYIKGINFQGKQTAYVNFGTQISALTEDLAQQYKGLFNEIMGNSRV